MLTEFSVSDLATFCWWTLTSVAFSDSLDKSADQSTLTSCSSQRGDLGSIVIALAEMLNSLTGIRAVVPGLLRVTILGHTRSLDVHPCSEVSVTADSISPALRTRPVTVLTSSGCNTILPVDFTMPAFCSLRT